MQNKTMLKTGDGVIGSEELYDDECGFVTYVINPWRGDTTPSRYIGWMVFTITYTFSGLKRPGASVRPPQEEEKVTVVKPLPPPPKPACKLQLSDWDIETIHAEMVKRKKGGD
jgi:hypothetical protein